MNALNEAYREAGWGRITDAAFNNRLEPKDVESQARDVARFAHKEIQALKAQIDELRKRTVNGY